MPSKPATICPRCQGIRRDGVCAVCGYERKPWAHRPDEPRHGSTRAWRNLRARKLKEEPLCERCKASGIVKIATQVHHVEPVARGGALLPSLSGLLSLCEACHKLREAEARSKANA